VVMLADLDGDGRLDAVSANRGDRTVSVRLNRTPAARFVPVFAEELVFPAAGAPASLAHADLNGAGAAGIALSAFGGPWLLRPGSLTEVILLDGSGVGLVLDDDLAADGFASVPPVSNVAGRTVIAVANALADRTVIAVAKALADQAVIAVLFGAG